MFTWPEASTPHVAVELSFAPVGIEIIVNHVKLHGMSKIADILVRSTLQVLVRVIVYSKVSFIIHTPPLRSTTEILSSRRGKSTVIVSGSVSRYLYRVYL